MIKVRNPGTIYQAKGQIENGSFTGRWHFSFDMYYDPEFMNFGALRVFNDDTLAKGAVWPLHPHQEIEVITYCASGEFKHEDENGIGGILDKGGVQHTTVGRGMYHSEINNRDDISMRFIQMWFIPEKAGLKPHYEQKNISIEERTNKLLLLADHEGKEALSIKSDVAVYSCFLEKGKSVSMKLKPERGYYLYNLEGGSLILNGSEIKALSAGMMTKEKSLNIIAVNNSGFLLVDVGPVLF